MQMAHDQFFSLWGSMGLFSAVRTSFLSFYTLTLIGFAGLGLAGGSAVAQDVPNIVLTASTLTPAVGAPVTLTATVTSSTGVLLTTGTVYFCSSSNQAPINECDVRPNGYGHAQVVKSGVNKGTATIKTRFGPLSYLDTVQAWYIQTTAEAFNGSNYLQITPTAGTAVASSATLAISGSQGAYTLSGSTTAATAATPSGLNVVDQTHGNTVIGTTGNVTPTNYFQSYAAGISQSVTEAAGTFPALADLNNDGYLDLVTTDSNASSGFFYLATGKADGTFNAPVKINVTLTPAVSLFGVKVADMDSDGIPDLVFQARSGSSPFAFTILIMKGVGNGTFTFLSQTAGVSTSYAPAIGDFNGDGILDIAYATGTTLSVALGVGDGTFGAATNYTVAANAQDVQTATLTSGYPLGLFVRHSSTTQTISVLTDPGVNGRPDVGSGVFGTPVTSTVNAPIVSYAVGDYTAYPAGSVAAVLNNGTVAVLRNDGNGTLGGPTYYSSGGGSYGSAFIQPIDGGYNFIVTNPITAKLVAFQNDANFANLIPVTITPAASFGNIQVGDLTGNGLNSVLTSSSSTIRTLTGVQTFTSTYTGSVPGGGSHTLVGQYPGDTSILTSTSNTVTATGSQMSASMVLSAAARTVAANATTVLTASMSSPNQYGYAIGGTATFYDGATVICTAAVVTNGSATCTTPALTAGTHRFTATYAGDTNFTGGATSGFTVRSGSGLATTTVLTTSSATATTAAPFTLTATVKDSNNAALSGGQVRFCLGSAASCTGTAVLATVQINKTTGVATYPVITSGGLHTYKAIFVANLQNTTSTSGTVTVTVTATPGASTTSTLASSGSAGNYTLTGTVSTTGNTAVTGTVNFIDASNGNATVASATLGAATFGSTVTYTTVTGLPAGQTTCYNSAPVDAVGDINGDGKMDELVYCNGEYIALGNGDGTFTYTVAPTGSGSRLADVNGDGKLDIIGTGTGGIRVALGNGDGTFQTSVLVGSNPYSSVTVLDLNGDGFLDIAIGPGFGSSFSVVTCLNNGDGTFQPCQTTQNQYPPAVAGFAYGDLNNDGYPDLTVGGYGSGYDGIYVFMNNGNGTFTNPNGAGFGTAISYTLTMPYVVLVDANKDGNLDLVVATPGTNNPQFAAPVYLYTGKGTGGFNAATTIGNVANVYGILLADTNNDGIPDVVVSTSTGSILFPGNGTTFTTGVSISSPFAAAFGDVTGDGLIDILSAGSTQVAGISQSASATASGVSIPGGGSHNIKSAYQGDAGYAASTSAAMALTGSPLGTTTVVTANPSSGATVGQSVTLTATISPSTASALTITGTVAFKDGGATIAGCSAQAVSSGAATCATTSLAASTHSITAVYSGDTNFVTSTSVGYSVTVSKGTATLTAAAKSYAYGTNPAALTATLAYSGANAPAGAVTFTLDGGAALTATCTGASSPLTCSYNVTGGATTLGSHNVAASFAGDANFNTATATGTTLTITQQTPTITVAGQNVAYGTATDTLTATLTSTGSGNVPTGAVTISVNGGAAQTATCSGSTSPLTCTVAYNSSTLAVASYNLSANYAGDTNYASAASTTTTFSVSKQTPTLVASAPAITYGTANGTLSTTVAYTGSGSAPTGAVTFKVDGGAAIAATCSGTASPLTCTASTSTGTLTVGSHNVSSFFATDSNYAAATSATATLTVNKGTVTVAATAPAITVGTASDSLSATLTFAGTAAPAGSVTFAVDGGAASAGSCSGTTSPITCTYSYASGSLTVGTHTVIAQYAGDANYALSSSPSANLVVNKGTITVTAAGATTNYGAGTVSLTASLVFAAGAPTPSGAVTFAVDGAGSFAGTCSGTTSPRTCSYTYAGVLTAGIHTVTATFAADTNYNAAASAATNFTVNKQTPALTASAGNITYGAASDTLTAVLSFTGGGIVPSGQVQLSVDGVTAGNGSCSGATSPITCTFGYSSAALAAGSHTVSAVYAGDTNYNGITSANGSFTVATASTTTIISGQSTGVSEGQQITLTGSVNGVPGNFSGGTMTFSQNGSAICTAVALTNNAATCFTPALVQGLQNFTVAFSGSGNYAAGNNNAAPFTIDVVPATNNATNGGTPAGQSAPPVTTTVGFTSSFTLNSITINTQGSSTPAFTITGGTCSTGTTYTAGQTCTVQVVYTNVSPGLVIGNVSLKDGSANVVGTAVVEALGPR